MRCVKMVIDEYNKGTSFEDILRYIQIDYAHPDFTNSVQNLGYMVLALLFGERDIEKTINYALYCGYDADCTCASAAAVIGILEGYSRIPDDLKQLLNDRYVCGIDVVRRDDKISSLAEDTCRVGLSLCREFGLSTIDLDNCHKDIELLKWEKPKKSVEITVDYENQPGLGINLDCPVKVHIHNLSSGQIKGVLSFQNLPDGFNISRNDITVDIPPNQTADVSVTISASESLQEFAQTNIVVARLQSDDGIVLGEYSFGVIGAVVWNIYGPFIEQRYFEVDPNLPDCHGGESNLPPVESMFANMALPDKEYLDEERMLKDAESFKVTRVINSVDDIIDIDNSFGIKGEAVFYAATDIVFDEDITKWVVCGNSDAYKLWINGELIQNFDEFRNWQPQTHGSLVQFKKGTNRVVVKLVRRAETLRFTFGLRDFTTRHYHGERWSIDYRSRRISSK